MIDQRDRNEEQRYELVERIAVGGMAEVFKAKVSGPHGFEKILAVKRILPELASNREFVDRFIAEAKIAATLNHANIVQVLDFSRFGDSLYIAMEFVDGVDLAAILSANRRSGDLVPLPAALHIANGLLAGLAHAHDHGVVHRDISPANVLLSIAGDVKITDFGIAKAAEGGSGHTHPHKIMGKWHYMSPEQARGDSLGPASDVFSAAVSIHELLTGQKLYDGEEVLDILHQIRTRAPPPPSSLRSDLPTAFDGPLIDALAQDPDSRTSSCKELLRSFVDACYAASIPTTAMDVADVVSAYREGHSDDEEGDTIDLFDKLINSELDRVAAPLPYRRTMAAAPAGDDGRSTGITLRLKFAPGERDAAGVARWTLVGDGGEIFDSPQAAADSANRTTQEAALLPPPSAVADSASRTTQEEAILLRTTQEEAILAEAILPPHLIGDGAPHPAPVAPISTPPAESAGVVPGGRPMGRRRLSFAAIGVVAAATVAGLFVYRCVGGGTAAEGDAQLGVANAVPDAGHPLDATVTAALVADANLGTAPQRAADAAPAPPDAAPVPELDAASGRDTAPHLADTSEMAVSIRSRPAGARVFLGSEELGATPLTRSFTGRARTIELRFEKDGYHSATETVSLAPGKPVRVNKRLQVVTGSIDLYVEPWANVYLGSKLLGEAPIKGLRLPVGTHRLLLVNPVLKREKTITVTVPSAKPYSVVLSR